MIWFFKLIFRGISMTAVEQSIAEFNTRIVSTLKYSLLPFASIPTFFSLMMSVANSEKDEDLINTVILPFSIFMGVVGAILLIPLGLLTLTLGALAVIAQTIFLPLQLIKSAIDDLYSTSTTEEDASVSTHASNASPEEANTKVKTPANNLSEFYGKLFDSKTSVAKEDDDILLQEIENTYFK